MRRSWKFWLLAVLALFVCVAVWLEPTEDDLFELCSTQGKPVIYRSVEAEGYYDGRSNDCWGCWNDLDLSEFRFIELSITKKRSGLLPLNEPGLYRVSQVNRDSEQCDEAMGAHYSDFKSLQRSMRKGNWCYQVEKLKKRRARFGRLVERLPKEKYNFFTGSTIAASRSYWVDYDSSETLAEFTSYSLSVLPILRISSFGTHKHCNSFVDRLGPRGFGRYDVVRPLSKNM